MTPRRKPIPSPIARPSDVGLAARPLAPARARSVLPTVAALLALGAMGCENGSGESIARDNVMSASLAQAHAKPRSTPLATLEDPSQPLPGMGALEEPTPQPAPTVAPVPTVTPPKHPYPVKGGAKAVHPVPTPIAMPGGLKAVSPPPAPPPIPPAHKPVKLSGDVAAVTPETT